MSKSARWKIKNEFKNIIINPFDKKNSSYIPEDLVWDYIRYQKTYDPMKYFKTYVRYIKNIEVSYSKRNIYAKIIMLLNQWETANWFVSCKVRELKNGKVKVRMSFLDFIKVSLIVKLKREFWLKDKVLQLIFLKLRYNVMVMPEWKKWKISSTAFWLMHDETIEEIRNYPIVKHVFPNLSRLYKEIEEKEWFVSIKYRENDAFEEALSYALNYRKSVYVYIDTSNLFGAIKYFINGSDFWVLEDWIHINLLKLLISFPRIEKKKNPSVNILRDEYISSVDNKKREAKEKYVEELTRKITDVMINIDEAREHIDEAQEWMNMRDLADTELSLSFYEIDVKEKSEEWKKDIDDFLKYNINWEYKILISNWEVKSAKNDFISNDLSKEEYEKLKEYVAWYWHVVPDLDAWIATRYKWEKRYRYWKNKSDN